MGNILNKKHGFIARNSRTDSRRSNVRQNTNKRLYENFNNEGASGGVGSSPNKQRIFTQDRFIEFPKLFSCFESLPDLRQFNTNELKKVYKLNDFNAYRKDDQKFPNNVNIHHVYMPFNGIVTGNKSRESYWSLIQEKMAYDFVSADDVEQTIKSYNMNMSKYSFNVLKVYERRFGTAYLKQSNDIRTLALRLQELLPKSIPLLKQGTKAILFLSQQQIGCLLANSFFCTFPLRSHQRDEYENYPVFNMINLFSSKDSTDLELKLEKLHCIFNYFERVIDYKPRGIVSFERQCLSKQTPNWINSKKSLKKLKFEVGLIEPGNNGYSEVDFANKYIGGGVLTSGSVQEEIRFLCSPELIVSRLFTESLSHDEALIITGAEQFNKCEGYSKNFRFKENYVDPTLHDKWGRRLNQIIAIDAFDFKTEKKFKQFEKDMIDRELNKALSGFLITDPFVRNKPAIVTGKWGCGVFNGDPHLKCLIQIMAAAEADRDLFIYTYNDQRLKDDLDKFYNQIKEKNVTIGTIYRILIGFRLSRNQQDNILVYINNQIYPSNTLFKYV